MRMVSDGVPQDTVRGMTFNTGYRTLSRALRLSQVYKW